MTEPNVTNACLVIKNNYPNESQLTSTLEAITGIFRVGRETNMDQSTIVYAIQTLESLIKKSALRIDNCNFQQGEV